MQETWLDQYKLTKLVSNIEREYDTNVVICLCNHVMKLI